jgi:hypothetical protein
VTLRDITLTRGSVSNDFGGAIMAQAGTATRLLRVSIGNSFSSLSGGALAVAPGNSVLEVTDSRFVGNLAVNGGAFAITANTTIRRSVFINNNASGGEGGAIQSYGPVLRVFDSTFNGNGASVGGAIFKRDAPVEIDGSAFTGNTASLDGGAVHTGSTGGDINLISRSGFTQNAAGRDGGAMFGRTMAVSLSIRGGSVARSACLTVSS